MNKARVWWGGASSAQRLWTMFGGILLLSLPLAALGDPDLAPAPVAMHNAVSLDWEATPEPADGLTLGVALDRERVALDALGWESREHGCGQTEWACHVAQVDANHSGELILDLSVGLTPGPERAPVEDVAVDASGTVLDVLAPLDPELEQVVVRSAEGTRLTGVYRDGLRVGAGQNF